MNHQKVISPFLSHSHDFFLSLSYSPKVKSVSTMSWECLQHTLCQTGDVLIFYLFSLLLVMLGCSVLDSLNHL